MPSGSEGMGSGYARGRVAVRPGLPNGRERTKSVRSMPSGSEGMGSGYARGRVAVHLTLPLASERTARRVQGRVAAQSVRSGPSGSEGMGSGYARGRVAVLLTLPLAGERTGLHVQGRVAVRTERSRSLTVQAGTIFGPMGITSASGNSLSGAYLGPSPETTPEREEISLQTGWFLGW